MYTRLFLVLIISLTGAACKNHDKKVATPQAEQITDANGNDFSESFFYKTLGGMVGDKPVVMHLLKYYNQVNANYYYTDIGRPIFLQKNWEAAGTDSIYLMENTWDENGLSPTITLQVNDTTINGYWYSGDGKKIFPVSLKEMGNDSSFPFRAYSYIDSAKYVKFKKDTPTLKSSIALVMASGADANAIWINSRFANILDAPKKNSTSTLPQLALDVVQSNVNSYTADVDSSLSGVSTSEQEDHFFLNREYSIISNIIYNSNGYVVVSFYNYAYTGGAHGNYYTAMHCYDVVNKSELALHDIMNIDSLSLQQLLEKNYRKEYRLKPSEKIQDRLLVNNIPPTKNLYLGARGLGFLYQPYEIASYADGEINIWIPFGELLPYLNPQFVKRMGI